MLHHHGEGSTPERSVPPKPGSARADRVEVLGVASTCGFPHSCRPAGTSLARAEDSRAGRHTCSVVVSRRWAVFLVLVGVWSWVIWPRFAVAIWNDDRSWANGGSTPTSFLWVHALLIAASLAIGTAVAVLGIRAWLAARKQLAARK
ncbi:SCO4848 family membrane protein [Dactylosporangium roseum]|uniref:SCO4848 family membrane protein n=1 Tax=Dactylosporangium roseum TaxID=47989 RepID=UPI0036F428E2